MPQPPTRSGRLSDLARHVVLPSGLVSTGWPAVRDKCLDLGITFDQWQDGAGRAILGKREDGKYAATVGGVVISIPRQVGKTFLIGAIVFALCLLFPGLTVLWTAHRMKTAGETFRSMQGMTRRRKIKPHIANVFTGSGDEEIRFRNGSRILFGARERGFGRGFAAVDVEVFDEAQILTENALDDMIPALNQSRHPSGALAIFTGTPPKPTDPGEVFSRMRDDCLSGESDDTVYIEFSADIDCNPDDWSAVEQANPSYPMHTPAEAIQRMRKKLSPDSYLREGLGIWGVLKLFSVFGVGKWEACTGAPPEGVSIGGLAVGATMDLSHAAIVAAGREGDIVHVKPLQHGPGTAWIVDRSKQLQDMHHVDVVVDRRGPAAALIPLLRRAGVRVREADTRDVLDACGQLMDLVRDQRLRHASYPELESAVSGAAQRVVGDRWAWGRRVSTADISTLEAATLAAWATAEPLFVSAYEAPGASVSTI